MVASRRAGRALARRRAALASNALEPRIFARESGDALWRLTAAYEPLPLPSPEKAMHHGSHVYHSGRNNAYMANAWRKVVPFLVSK